MSIVKNTPLYLKHSKKNFTTNQNNVIEAIKDPAALGIYVYLSSKPENWNISSAHLQKHFNKGRDFIAARLKILKDLGLMKSTPIRDKAGVILYWETILFNEIEEQVQNTENTYSSESSRILKIQNLENHTTNNKRDIKNKREHTNSARAREEDLFDILFFCKKQREKARGLKRLCERDPKSLALYTKLPDAIKAQKTFEDVIDECITFYASRKKEELVSPQRLISWINRDVAFHNKPRIVNNKKEVVYDDEDTSWLEGMSRHG